MVCEGEGMWCVRERGVWCVRERGVWCVRERGGVVCEGEGVWCVRDGRGCGAREGRGVQVYRVPNATHHSCSNSPLSISATNRKFFNATTNTFPDRAAIHTQHGVSALRGKMTATCVNCQLQLRLSLHRRYTVHRHTYSTSDPAKCC